MQFHILLHSLRMVIAKLDNEARLAVESFYEARIEYQTLAGQINVSKRILRFDYFSIKCLLKKYS